MYVHALRWYIHILIVPVALPTTREKLCPPPTPEKEEIISFVSPGDYIDERVGGIFFLPLVLPISIERCVRKRKEREKKSCLEGKQKLKGKLGRDHKRKVSFFNTPSMHVNKCINTTYVHSILANFLRPIHESSLRGFMELPYVYRISAIGVKNVCHRRRRARRDSPM